MQSRQVGNNQQRNGSRQGANRLASGNRAQVGSYPVQAKQQQQINHGGIPKTNPAPQRGWQMNNPKSIVNDSSKIAPKFNNVQVYNGDSNHNNGSIFDQNSKLGVGKNGLIGNVKNYNMPQISDQIENADVLVENEMLRSELQKMHEKMKQMEKIIKDKDNTINKQRTDLTNLRKKNFDFRSRITELEDKAKNDTNAGARHGSRNPRADRRHGAADGHANEAAIVMQLQRQQMRERENQMIMMTMMESIQGATGVEAEEQRLLQQALEASRGDADPSNPNTDNMTYEELLQLEDRNGKVSKGLTPTQIRSIKAETWMRNGDTAEPACSICFENFERGQKFKKLPKCPHEYHAACIDKWLEGEKRCPICNENVV